MATARYWRVVGVEAFGGSDLALSELQLHGASGRVDVGALLTSSHAPVVGSLAALGDANTATDCIFSGAHVRSAGFWIAWDLGSAQEVRFVRPGSADDKASYVRQLILQRWDGTQWVVERSLGQFIWLGARTVDNLYVEGDELFANVELLLDFEGASGSQVIIDKSQRGRSVAAYGDAKLSATGKFGSSLVLDGNGDYLTVASDEGLNFRGGDFRVEAFVRKGRNGVSQAFLTYGPPGQGSNLIPLLLLRWNANDTLQAYTGPSTSAESGVFGNITSSASYTSLTEYYYVAYLRAGNQFYLMVNDTVVGTASSSTLQGTDPTAVLHIGRDNRTTFEYFAGNVDSLRITKGNGRSVTPVVPTGPFPEAEGGAVFDPFGIRTVRTGASIAASAAVPGHACLSAKRVSTACDVEFGGQARIWGTTKIKGTPNVPTKARVVLQHQRSKLPVRETWSDPVTGAYEFVGMDANQQFLTLVEDAAGNFRPVVASKLVPEVSA